jgi:cytochrome c peroxidase
MSDNHRHNKMSRHYLPLLILVAAGCSQGQPGMLYSFKLPAGFPEPIVPADNPMTPEKVKLGRYLFYDQRLSGNQTFSCASCHQQSLAFTDGKALPLGSTGAMLARNSMALGNVAYYNYLTWSNPLITTIEEQMLVPMFGDAPIELGLAEAVAPALARLRADVSYQDMFAAAFPGQSNAFVIQNVINAIASFERTLIDGSSAYDRYEAGDTTAMSASAVRGKNAFFAEKLDCYHCHAAPTFTTSFVSMNTPAAPRDFRNDAIYNIDGAGGFPANNTGLYGFTQFNNDMGKFRIPTLRNIMLTAPYFHDGSAATIDDVIDSYAHGGRLIAAGQPNAGDGSTSPHRDPLVKGFTLSDDERADLKAFLDALTDEDFITNPDFSDPFQ